jgi:hypothetical protein
MVSLPCAVSAHSGPQFASVELSPTPPTAGGAHHWALAMTLIQTAKLNGVDPMAWLTDVLERLVSGQTKTHELHTLLPWNWQACSPEPETALAA